MQEVLSVDRKFLHVVLAGFARLNMLDFGISIRFINWLSVAEAWQEKDHCLETYWLLHIFQY